ncbi:unnamed protein product [Rotaria socialis]|nr:unnamed protein product [Rotaria socialis]CAF3799209.1 unnamed protein product [Rotaria socialis]
MTDSANIVDIHPTEYDPNQEIENINSEQIRQVTASINQDFSKNYVRLTIKIPQMKTYLNWRTLSRNTKNGVTTKAAYNENRVYFQFILNQGKLTETKYEYSSREPFHGLIEYNKSYFKYKDERVIWFIHKAQSW